MDEKVAIPQENEFVQSSRYLFLKSEDEDDLAVVPGVGIYAVVVWDIVRCLRIHRINYECSEYKAINDIYRYLVLVHVDPDKIQELTSQDLSIEEK